MFTSISTSTAALIEVGIRYYKRRSVAIVCGVLLVCNYVPREQQTAALDSYSEVLQSGLGDLLQNVARLQQIRGNLNTVWQQKMNTAKGSPDGAKFVAVLNRVQAQLDQFFGTYTDDAAAIVGGLEVWTRSAKNTFLRRTASYQTQRNLLLASFNESITNAGEPDMLRRRQCAQRSYAQFEAVEVDYLLASGRPYANAAREIAAQSAGLTVLENVGEAAAMRLLMAFESTKSLPQDAFDNWNAFFQRIFAMTGSFIEEVRQAVQSSMTNVDASIAVPNSLIVALEQVKNDYDLCVGGMGRKVPSRFSGN